MLVVSHTTLRPAKQSTTSNVMVSFSAAGIAFVVTRCVKKWINIPNKQGETLLLRASQGGNARCVQLLLSCEADVNKGTTSNVTPLFETSVRNDLDMVNLLLDGKADVHAQTSDGFTPLSTANEHGCYTIMQCLQENGCNTMRRDFNFYYSQWCNDLRIRTDDCSKRNFKKRVSRAIYVDSIGYFFLGSYNEICDGPRSDVFGILLENSHYDVSYDISVAAVIIRTISDYAVSPILNIHLNNIMCWGREKCLRYQKTTMHLWAVVIEYLKLNNTSLIVIEKLIYNIELHLREQGTADAYAR